MIEKKNEIHDEFCSRMQDAHEEYLRSTTDAPAFSRDDFEKLEKSFKRDSRRKRMKFAACFLVFLLAGASFGIWFNADGVHGGKMFLSKCLHVFSPLDVEEQVLEDGTVQEVYTITDESDLDEAMQATGHSLKLTWLPKQWSFQQLVIISGEDGSSWEYLYSSGSKNLIVSADSGDPANLAVTGNEQVTTADGTTYYITSEGTGLTVLCVRADKISSQILSVSGPVSQEEAIRILEHAQWK